MLKVEKAIGAGGWQALLAEALLLSPIVRILETTKDVLEEATEEDMKRIWEAFPSAGVGTWRVYDSEEGLTEHVQKQKGEQAWLRLKQVRSMSKEEWAATKKTDEEDDEDEETGDGEDADDGEESGGEEESGEEEESDEEMVPYIAFLIEEEEEMEEDDEEELE